MDTTRQPKKYAAFISYRHLSPDMEIAEALHKMLEHNLVRPDRHSPRNIRPVFLDKGELPILEDLDSGIIEALENSECLFVICSPNLPLSKYCMREISHFIKINGGSTRRIYTLLVDGEPAQAFPEILRSEIRHVRGEDGVDREERIDVEPLFADVRAPSLKESLKKLRKTEFLRLAAAYYGCTYDQLYKRHKRWILKMAGLAAAGVLAISGVFSIYAHVRNMQYNASRAAAYASYAEERIEAGDELLALTLCEEGYPSAVSSGSEHLFTAMRSAIVQNDHRQHGLPFGQAAVTPYMGESNPVFYLSEDSSMTVIMAGNICQISDAKTGEIYHQLPQDSLAVEMDGIDRYVTVSAVMDENGIYHDTMSLYSLDGNQLLGSFAFRETSSAHPNYKLLTAIETNAVLILTDSGEYVAYMTREGEQLTKDEAAELMIVTNSGIPAVTDEFRIVTKKTLISRERVIQNAAGETVYTIKTENGLTAFSGDWRYFAYLDDGVLTVLDTQSWSVQGQIALPDAMLQDVILLSDSTYLFCNVKINYEWSAVIYDWSSGREVAHIDGYAYPSEVNRSIYSMADGLLTRYSYNQFDLAREAQLEALAGDLALARNSDGLVILSDVKTGEILLETDCPRFGEIHHSDDLSRILVHARNTAACYSAQDGLLWSVSAPGSVCALSPDGSLAAWIDDEGSVQVADGATGSVLYTVPADRLNESSVIFSIALSPRGVCITDDVCSLWFAAGNSEGIDLGHYTFAKFASDNLLFLESDWAYVDDFLVYDVAAMQRVYRPAENTGEWAFSASSGYLARHLETSGSHSKPLVEILRYADGGFASCGTIYLPGAELSMFSLDSAGRHLSFTAGDTTSVIALDSFTELVRLSSCSLRYENGRFWGDILYGTQIYSFPMLESSELHAHALDALTGADGVRTLSPEERSRYSFEK